MTGLALFPTVLVDIGGSLANIILAFLALRHAYQLMRRWPENVLWGYLFYTCLAIAAFSISRGVGHIVKQLLLMLGNGAIWSTLSPWSGGLNTLLMISVAAIALYYHKGVEAYEAIRNKTIKLKEANYRLKITAEELQALNLSLEEKVTARTMELSKSEKKFRHLFSASKDMVFFCDITQEVVDINESGSEMLGYEPNEPSLLNLGQIFHNRADLEFHHKTLKTAGYIKDMEVEFERKDGSVIYVLFSSTAVYNDKNELVGCAGIAKDMTRLKMMMEQLLANEKMASVGQMAAGVAHEINTPLGVILGYAQLMKDDFSEDSETYEGLEVIERQTKVSRKIVADLLKFSRQTESSRKNFNLNDVLEDVVAVTEHNLKLDHIQVFLHLAENLHDVVGGAEKLTQVIVNLVNNAHHAMESQGGGELHLGTIFDAAQGTITVEVRDTGQGIPKEVRAKIFDPFFTTKQVGKGTGLGLSVSYGIVQDHQGTIEVESPVQGIATDPSHPGTIFRLVFPSAEKTEPPIMAL
jgi:two-component system NtrC family sensor kinase